MKLSPRDKKVLVLRDFRKAMGVDLTQGEAKEIWGDSIDLKLFNQLPKKDSSTPVVSRKIKVAKKYVKTLLLLSMVRYIGVSGSVGAGFASKDDDIDLFIVVRDHTSWIYRFFTKIRLGRKAVWYGEENQKDKICLNFICEERGLNFANKDIFTLNEIFSLKHIYNEKYWSYIRVRNTWLVEEFNTEEEGFNQQGGFSPLLYLLFPFNFILFLVQLFYMFLLRHKPNLQRLWEGFKKGRIEFYPEGFRVDKLKEFEGKRS